MTEEKKTSLHPISIILCKIYNSLIDKGSVCFPLNDIQISNIDSIVKTAEAEYFGVVRFPTNELKAAAYFCFIIKDHAVTDGNKRMAVLFLQVFCDIVKIKINLQPHLTLDVLAVAVEQHPVFDDELIRVVEFLLFIANTERAEPIVW